MDWKQFSEALRQCRWSWVLLSMALGVLVFYIRGCRWRMLLLPLDPAVSRTTCFNAYNICMAVNLAVPRAGEFARLGYVVKHSSRDASGARLLSFDRSLGTLVVERIWDAIVVVAMGALLVAVKWESFGSGALGGFAGLFSKAGLWIAAISLLVVLTALVYLAWRFRDGFMSGIWAFIMGIAEGLKSFLHMKRWWVFLVMTALIWFLYWIMSACIVWALADIPAFAALDVWDAFFLMIAGSVSSVIPVPGGFGAYHGVVAGALLSIWNIPMGTGMIFATLSHESQAVTQALAGLVSYLYESFVRK